MDVVRELRWCDERVGIFHCLVMDISRDENYYVHARLAIYHLATILEAQSRQVAAWLVPGHWSADRSSPSTSLLRRRDNMDRASQLPEQSVPPDVPRPYRTLVYYGIQK